MKFPLNITIKSLANRIIYDHTLVSDHDDSKLIDFLVFLRCGLVCSHDFLRMLFRNFGTLEKMRQVSFNGIINELITFFHKKGAEINQFGYLFERAFHYTINGKLLSDNMKKLLGCLLHLLWSVEINQISFQYTNFLLWLDQLGFPIDFPEQLLVSDYVEAVLKCIAEGEMATPLIEIGKLGENKQPNEMELLQTVELYKNILMEIRRKCNDE